MRFHSPDQTQLLRALVRYHGSDPQLFEAAVLDDGSIRVLGPGAAAFYPADAWTSRFLRHLHKGWFDPQRAPTAAGA
jgi:hypothetical protein